MMKLKYNILLWLFLFSGKLILAQEVLSLQQAIDSALLNNYRIAVARNEVEIAQNNNHPGQAGMLPTVGLNISDTPANNNIRQEFANGSEIVRNNVNSNNLNAQIAASMTLFDGGRMFALRNKLGEQQSLAELTLKAEVQNLISDVVTAYTALTALQQNEKVLERLKSSAQARKQLVEIRISAGMANQSDLYLAELDLENANQALISIQRQIHRSSTALLSLMKSTSDRTILVSDSLSFVTVPEKWKADQLYQNNPEIQMSNTSVRIAIQGEKEMSALRYPKITLTAAYGYLLSQSQAGFSLYNQSYGASGSIGINIPLFSGHVFKNNYENAILTRKNVELTAEQTKNDVLQRYFLAWNLYESALEQKAVLQKGLSTAMAYLDLMTLRFNEGQSTVLELREAERSFEEANLMKINNDITLKLAETDILRISGQLIH
ncbi:MAG: TolC family protein [Flavobacteriales bacterium]|nr:TolC family protein [Flavobacteriales bacterium]